MLVQSESSKVTRETSAGMDSDRVRRVRTTCNATRLSEVNKAVGGSGSAISSRVMASA